MQTLRVLLFCDFLLKGFFKCEIQTRVEVIKSLGARCSHHPNSTNGVKCFVCLENTSNHFLLALRFDFEQLLLGKSVEKKKKDKTKIKCRRYPCCFPSPLQLIINFLLDLSLKSLEIKTMLNKRLFLRYNRCCDLLCLICFVLCVLRIS